MFYSNNHRYIRRLNPPNAYCDAKCKAGIICGIKTSRSGDHSLCNNLPDGLSLAEIDEMARERQAC